MKRSKLTRKALTLLLTLVMLFSTIPAVFASPGTGETTFPLIALNGTDIVANGSTQYTTSIVQDPATKLITATFTITNASTGVGAVPIVISGVGVQLSFDSRISPFEYNPTIHTDHIYNALRLYSGGPNDSIDDFKKYVYAPRFGFDTVGSSTIQNNAAGRFIGAKISTVEDHLTISLAPGESTIVAHMYFMPTNGQDLLDINMFSYQWSTYPSRMIRLSTWIANGTRFMVSSRNYPTSTATWVHAPQAFKIDFEQRAPLVTADTTNRVINGYNAATMEWSVNGPNGPYQSGVPIVSDDGATYNIRYAATPYSGNDPEYNNYKRYLASAPTVVSFDPNFFSAANDVSLNKTSVNVTRNDGTTRVNDTLRYTVVAKNDGHPLSTWANAMMVDVIPAGVTFAGNVYRGTQALVQGTDYTFAGNTLTVPLGNIAGGTQVDIRFDVTVNSDAYGVNVKNSVSVFGKDGIDGDDLDKTVDEDGSGHTIRDRSGTPTVDDITEGDRTITGTGVAGAQITVTLPNGAASNVTVAAGGTWTFNVPAGVNLLTGNEIKVVQNETGKDPSEEVTAIVGGRPAVIKYGLKTSRNTSRTDGTWRVGDIVEYTVVARNDGPAKSLWENVIVEDTLPTEVTYVANSARIDNLPAGAAASFANGTLTVDLGDIAGGVTRTLTFQATINETAYGKTFKNTALIDGDPYEEDDDEKPDVVDRSPQPNVDEINDGDRIVTGTGVPGARIEVTFPNFITKGIATVGNNGNWSVNVPIAVNLIEDDEVSVVQIVGSLDPSLPVVVKVEGKKNVIPNSIKYAENETSSDDKTRVNDRILYTIEISNDGSDKSLWYEPRVFDTIPEGLTYETGSARLDNQIPTYSFYNISTRELVVRIDGGVRGGETRVVTFYVTVDADAHGKTFKNVATIEGKDNIPTGPDVKEEIEDEEGDRTVIIKSDEPTVDPVTRDDKIITGTGEPGADIIVTLDDGTKIETEVGNDGKWQADIPNGKEPDTGDTIKVVQIEPDKDPSDEVIVTVLDKTYRAVTGIVWPQEFNDMQLGQSFLDKHNIVVELRATFRTAADPALRTVAVLIPGTPTGRFTIENVPFGNYVLTIKRPGFLIRAMNVTISPSDPDLKTLTSPGTAENGIFNLWWGDCNDDFRIDNEDIMMVLELMELGVNATHQFYNPHCDMNADALIDNEDIMMILERWNRYASEYPGAETVDFFS
ncbi:MAG: Ig-like domain-containing protein [Oscillospiraceae bacterium]|nr:Ig-like domain-containing protein [Oscillospiraceae bacterium]